MPRNKQLPISPPEDMKAKYRAIIDNIERVAAELPHADENDPIHKFIVADEPLYEYAIGELASRRQEETERRFATGAAGSKLKTRYGGGIVASFAGDVGEATRTVYDYIAIFSFYEDGLRRAFSDRNESIVYSHFRTSMRLGLNLARHKGAFAVDEAWEFIDKCAANGWSPDQAQIEADLLMVHDENDGEGNEEDKAMEIAGRLTFIIASVPGEATLTIVVRESQDIIDELMKCVGSIFHMKVEPELDPTE